MCLALSRHSGSALRDQACIHKASRRVSEESQSCSEEIEQITKPILTEASVIRISLCWSSGVCYSSSGIITPAEDKFELGMDFCRCQIRLSHEFSVQNIKAGCLEQFSTLLVWDITVFMSTGILYVGVDRRQKGLVCVPEECKGLRTRDQYAETTKKKIIRMFIGPNTVSLTIFCRENANKEKN